MQALRLSLEIGAAMMESGGEVRRTEDTVTRINYAAGATDAQVWAVPGILTATVILADNTTHTGTKRLGSEEIDLAELDRLNTLSRRLCRGETVDWTVTKRRIYSRRTRLLCTFLATAAFCIYFGGTWAEAMLCGGFGILVSGYRPALQSGFTAVLLDATVAGLLAFTPQALGLPLRGANILIGTIMLLVPGLTVGNALRDMIDGDLLAGLLQLAEAVLCALAIAWAVPLPFGCRGAWGGERDPLRHLWHFRFFCFMQVPRRLLFFTTFGGLLSGTVYRFAEENGMGAFGATLWGMLAVALYAELLARVLKTPSTVLLYPSTVPLLPGSAIYYAMQYLLWGQPDQAVAYASQTLQIATGMGLGAVLVAVPIRLLRAHREQK